MTDSSGSGGWTIAVRDGKNSSSEGGGGRFISACIKPGSVHYRVVARAAFKAAGTR